jgi:transposase InsO family protein
VPQEPDKTRALAVKFQQVVVHSVENWEADVVEARANPGDRMDYHHNARQTIHGREELAKCVVEGRLSRATVSRILTRLKLNKTKMLEPRIPIVRYEHAVPGDLLHIDIKKLARIVKPGHGITGNPQDETRGAGWEFLYVAVDDRSRLAFTAMMPDEKAASAAAFLHQAADYFARLGIAIRRVMTDNGPCFISDRFRHTCRKWAIKHIRTRIYTPRTNGKAERFIQTAIREWAYERLYQNSAERTAQLNPWTHQYNWHRPHASLNQRPPISRVRSDLDVNNLLRHDI